MTERDRRSYAAFKGWRTRRQAKSQVPKCPVCGDRMPHGAAEHERIRHVDLWIRRAQQKGELV